MRSFIQHHCNPLHLYCRLRGLGLSRLWAWRIARVLQGVINPVLY